MRGFPLLSALFVVLLSLLAWWPLHRFTANEQVSMVKQSDLIESKSELVRVRITGTGKMMNLQIQHLGKVIIAGGGDDTFVQEVEGLVIPNEGLDLWVEAEFVEKDKRSALEIEIGVDSDDFVSRTLWSKDGVISDSVYFQRDN